jgi:hypothetical protein
MKIRPEGIHEIPFGDGKLSLQYALKIDNKGVSILIGFIDPPILPGEIIPEDRIPEFADIAISFKTMSDLDRLQDIHDDLMELLKTGTIQKLEGNKKWGNL